MIKTIYFKEGVVLPQKNGLQVITGLRDFSDKTTRMIGHFEHCTGGIQCGAISQEPLDIDQIRNLVGRGGGIKIDRNKYYRFLSTFKFFPTGNQNSNNPEIIAKNGI